MRETTDQAAERKVVVSHQYTLLRQALARLIAGMGFGPVFEAGSPGELLRVVSEERPEIVLVEWDGEGAVAQLSAVRPRPTVVVLAAPDSQRELSAALRAGANGYVSLNVTAEELAQTINLLGRGGLFVSSEMAGGLSARESGASVPEQAAGLSGREREVLELVASGATNREIAEALVVTENTVKVHLRNVLDKLNLRNRQQAAVFAVREGIVVGPAVVEEARARPAQ